MLATSVWVLLLNLAGQAIFSTDVVVVGAVLGTVAVAAYQVALGPAMGVKNVSDQFGAVSLTAAASLNAQKSYEELRRLMTEATRVVVSTVAPGVVVFVVWGRRLIELWAGKSYTPSYPTLVVLSLALLVAAIQGTSASMLFALNRYKRLALLAIAEAATNVGLSIFLAKKLGIVGVAWGTAIPITVMTLGVYVPMACRLVRLRYIDLGRRLALPLAVNGILYLILREITRSGGVFPNIVVLLAACLGVFITCFSLSILLDPKERSTYLDMVRGAVGRPQE
jgi:O-antigen/teichoic acid export membrane protein